MAGEFHKDMDRYMTGRRRKETFSHIKKQVDDQKKTVVAKAGKKLVHASSNVKKHLDKIKPKKQDEKEISVDQINALIENKPAEHATPIKAKEKDWAEMDEEGNISKPQKLPNLDSAHKAIKSVISTIHKKGKELKAKKKIIKAKDKEGWAELNLEQQNSVDMLKEQKDKLAQKIAKLQGKKEHEKQKLSSISQINQERKRAETSEEKKKRLALESEINTLKEQQKREEERLNRIKKARRLEQLELLKGKAKTVLKSKPKLNFPKRQPKESLEEITRETDPIKPNEEAPKEKPSEVSEEPVKKEVPKVETKQKEEKKVEKPKVKVEKKKEKKPRRSFLSNIIQIKSAAEIEKETKDLLKKEADEHAKNHDLVSEILENTDIPNKEQPPTEDTIHVDDDYKIKVVKND